MGMLAIQALDRFVHVGGETFEQEVIGTDIVTHIQDPLVLPDVVVDDNRGGNVAVVCYILFGLIAASAIAFNAWTFHSRKLHVVKASQPLVLIMVDVGILIMAYGQVAS